MFLFLGEEYAPNDTFGKGAVVGGFSVLTPRRAELFHVQQFSTQLLPSKLHPCSEVLEAMTLRGRVVRTGQVRAKHKTYYQGERYE